MPTKLPPFDPAATCPKFGYGDVKANYHEASGYICKGHGGQS